MKKYSLQELNEFIRRVISLNLPEPLWIKCEISQIGRSRGQMYLELIEKDEISSQVLAQSRAVLWARQYQSIKRDKGNIIDQILTTGQSVLLLAKVEFSERYGMSLVIQDIDTTFTLGALALKRRETIKRLMELKLIGKNKKHSLPKVIQKIAIISSERAAGYKDFVNQLVENEWGYHFDNQLFAAAMQGDKSEEEIVHAIRRINTQPDKFDLIIIIRGGGAKLDLAAFDLFNISKAIANAALPVLTGIGHEIDESVADMVAHTALKTPTAVADFIVQHNATFEAEAEQAYLRVVELTRFSQQKSRLNLQNIEHNIQLKTQHFLNNQQRMLDFIAAEIPRNTKAYLNNQTHIIENLDKNITLLNPENTLKRGFTLTLKKGQLVKNATDLKEKDVIKTVFWNGERISEVLE